MKKMFKIVISAIICMALVLVPMTVMAEEGIDYNINYETNLSVGTNNYAIDSTVPYTVYILYPTAVGEYTITSDAKMGIVSYLDMWVQFEPTENIVNLNTITWSCTDVNQAIMVAVKSDSSEATITISHKDPNVSEEVVWTFYENSVKPEKFEMPEFVNLDAFEDGYVDFEDDKIDDAVLGDDGYYHLNDKNGPVLFANLNDSIMSLYTMVGYGKISAIYYDDDGKVVKKVDYTDAFNEYVAALPTNSQGTITSYYYPLTADLIEMFKEVGATHDWYDGDSPWVYASEDAWLYGCYYDEDVTNMGTSTDDNNSGDTPSTDGENENETGDNTSDDTNGSTNDTTNNNDSENANTDTDKKSPNTGDSVATVTVALICAASLVISAKKKF